MKNNEDFLGNQGQIEATGGGRIKGLAQELSDESTWPKPV